jgi:metal-responsive CopG/Arc/MetJ family transcriptional regulator
MRIAKRFQVSIPNKVLAYLDEIVKDEGSSSRSLTISRLIIEEHTKLTHNYNKER